MGAIIFLMFLLFCIGVIYPASAIAFFKLYKRSPKSIKAILDEI